MIDPLNMLFEVFVILGNFPSHVQDILKSSLFCIEVAPFILAHLL